MKLIQPEQEIKLWDKLSTLSKLTLEIIVRNDSGRRYVTRRDLRRIWGCTDEAIKGYIRKGMPQVDVEALTAEGVARAKKIDPKFEFSLPMLSVYDLAEVNAWKDNNVQAKKSPTRLRDMAAEVHEEDRDTDSDEETNPSLKGYALREIIAKTEQAEEQAKISALKRKALEGSLVEAEDLDKAMAEQAVLHKTDKINDEKVLPTLLEMKSAGEIATILYEHNQERLAHFDKIINKEFDCPETLYDVIGVVMNLINLGASPKDIIEAINA